LKQKLHILPAIPGSRPFRWFCQGTEQGRCPGPAHPFGALLRGIPDL